MEDLEMTANLRKYYQGKKVLLTGHTGFKGSWMLMWLNSLGAEVTGLALEPERTNDLYRLINGDELCRSVICDIRNADSVIRLIGDLQPDYIFHFAAQALVRSSYRIPVETFDVNIMGSVHVMEGMRRLEKPCTGVMITTDKVYENMEWDFHYKEDDRLGGFDPYSSSKAGAEIAISSYMKAFFRSAEYEKHGKSLASARGGNVIGGGDRAAYRLIPDLVRSLEKKQPLEIRHPEAVRPWQHVLELLCGYLKLGCRLSDSTADFAGSYNFGPEMGDEMTVGELVETALEIWGSGEYKHTPDPEKLHEAGKLKLDISKAKEILGWIPKWNSRQAVAETLSWYRDVMNGRRAADVCREQIKKYTDG